MNLFYQPLIPEGLHHLDEEESRHCVKVLRKSVGDTIHLTDGKGFFYQAFITRADARKCEFSLQKAIRSEAKSYSIHIAVSPTKNADRIEWFVEKATEFGIDTISLINCENSERSFIKIERLQKLAISAMKQSIKSTLPAIREVVEFPTFVRSCDEIGRFVAYVDHENPIHLKNVVRKNQSTVVLIGPEGDFTPGEIELANASGFVKVSLGQSRLRTETAAIAACHIANLAND
ncbi:MAG TPA: 16S rRNA (uracil(1498)-N(3))-methyltransferase [Chryseosolibacter sp.]